MNSNFNKKFTSKYKIKNQENSSLNIQKLTLTRSNKKEIKDCDTKIFGLNCENQINVDHEENLELNKNNISKSK